MANMTFGVNLIPHNNTPTGSNTYTLGNSSYKWKLYADELNGQPLTNASNVYYVEGPSTDTTSGTWTGTITGLSAYYDGLTVLYVPAIAGGSSSTTLNLNSKGAITCYSATNSAIDSSYIAGEPIMLVYKSSKWIQCIPQKSGSDIFMINAINTNGNTDSSYWTVDKTFSEIYAANQAGKTLLLYLKISSTNTKLNCLMSVNPNYPVSATRAGFLGVTAQNTTQTRSISFIISSTDTYTFNNQLIGERNRTDTVINYAGAYGDWIYNLDGSLADGYRLYAASDIFGEGRIFSELVNDFMGQNAQYPSTQYMLLNIYQSYESPNDYTNRMSTFKFEYCDNYYQYDDQTGDDIFKCRMLFSSMYMDDLNSTLYRRYMLIDGTGLEDLVNDGIPVTLIDIAVDNLPPTLAIGTIATGAAGSNASATITSINSNIDLATIAPAITNDWAILYDLSDVPLLPNTKYEFSIKGVTSWSYALYLDNTKLADPVAAGGSAIITTPSTISGDYLKLVGDEGAGTDTLTNIRPFLIAPSLLNLTIPRGDQGPQGDSYVITAQDKQDIADLLEDEFVDDTGWEDLDSYIKPSLIDSGSLKFRRIGSLIYILFGGTLKGTLNASTWLTVNQTSGGTTIPIPEEWRPNATIYIPGYSQTAGSCIRVTSAGMIAIRNQTGSQVKGVDSGGSWWINSHGCYLASGGMLSSGLTEVHLTGATQTVTAEANTRYICDTVITELTFTPPSSGITDIIFTTGSTLPVVTFPSTVKFPEWFEVETEKIYEINILNGIYAVVGVWEA